MRCQELLFMITEQEPALEFVLLHICYYIFISNFWAMGQRVYCHNSMTAEDSAVVLLELDVQCDLAEPTNKQFISAYLQIKYFLKEKFRVIHFD